VTWSRQKTLWAATAGCSVRERTPDPRHAAAMAFTGSNKWITWRVAPRFDSAVRYCLSSCGSDCSSRFRECTRSIYACGNVNVGAQSRTPTARTFPKHFSCRAIARFNSQPGQDYDYSPCSLTNFPFGSTSNPDCLPFALTNTS